MVSIEGLGIRAVPKIDREVSNPDRAIKGIFREVEKGAMIEGGGLVRSVLDKLATPGRVLSLAVKNPHLEWPREAGFTLVSVRSGSLARSTTVRLRP